MTYKSHVETIRTTVDSLPSSKHNEIRSYGPVMSIRWVDIQSERATKCCASSPVWEHTLNVHAASPVSQPHRVSFAVRGSKKSIVRVVEPDVAGGSDPSPLTAMLGPIFRSIKLFPAAPAATAVPEPVGCVADDRPTLALPAAIRKRFWPVPVWRRFGWFTLTTFTILTHPLF